MALTLQTAYSPDEAANLVSKAIIEGSFSAELVAQSASTGPNGVRCITLLFDKYYMRAGNHCALCVSLDNLSGATKVFAASAGTKQGLLDFFDWGAGDDFEEEVRRALGNC